MIRISDARMSGTSYGACILHVSPEAHLGGNFALVQSGDIIALDVPNRTLNVLLSDEEWAVRRANFKQRPAHYQRGYGYIFQKHITQAHEGCDFDFLESDFGEAPPEPAIY
jgi:dihydroxyacid dehydratase/phosphogluconate dehydratase